MAARDYNVALIDLHERVGRRRRTSARLKLIKRHTASDIEGGPAILHYTGLRIRIDELHGGLAMKKAAKSARR